MISDGPSMIRIAKYGVPRRSTRAAHSGRIRSNAVAKMTRLAVRNTVPTQPKNHSDIRRITMNCSHGLTKNEARVTGYGHTPPIWSVPFHQALLAEL